MTTPTLILTHKAITKITMLWSEGHEAEDLDFPTLADFQDFIDQKILPNHDCPGCYLKTKFRLTFEDGDTYTGRLDVQPGESDLREHILETCIYCAKQALRKGDYQKAEEWIAVGQSI